MNMIVSIIINAVAVFAIAYLLPEVNVDGPVTALLVAVALGIANVTIKPVLKLLTLPINLLTLGVFGWVVNAFIIYLITLIISGFTITGTLTYLIFAILLSIISTILSWIFK